MRTYRLGVHKGRRDDVDLPYYAAYVQDDWHVSGRLTLNLGLRYDLTWNSFARARAPGNARLLEELIAWLASPGDASAPAVRQQLRRWVPEYVTPQAEQHAGHAPEKKRVLPHQ